MKPVNFLEDNIKKNNNIKKILNDNKIIVYLIPLLLILIFIGVDYSKLKNNTYTNYDNSNNFSDSKLKEVKNNLEQQPSTVFVYDENDESSIDNNTGAGDKTNIFFNELEKVEKNDKIVQDMFNLLAAYKGSDKIKVNEFYFDDYNRTVIIGDASKPEFIDELISKLSNTYRIDFILEDMRPSEYGSYFKIVGELNGTI